MSKPLNKPYVYLYMRLQLSVILLVVIVLTSVFHTASAQKKGLKTVKPTAEPYKLFFEKIYIHTDRDFYATGDDIWFKAYLVNGESNHPTYSSNNLYVDLISPDAKILSREIIRIDSGMGTGDFRLTDSIPDGIYHLKAYTNWIRNFGDNFVFDKKIIVHSVAGLNPIITATDKKGKTDKNKFIIPAAIPNSYHINFFPEGGALVEGVAGLVGFKAEDALGNGIKVSGGIVSSKGDTIGHFESTDMGLGTFNMLPEPGGKYTVIGSYKNNRPFKSTIAPALSQGYSMHIKNNDSANVQVFISTNQPTLDAHKGKQLTIVAKHAQMKVFVGQFKLNDLQSAINIPKAQLPAGVTSIILYDEQMHPNCERLLYINKGTVKLTVMADKPSYAPKEKSTITIQAITAQNQPVQANLSLAVIDGSVVPADEANIVSYLMLQSEVKGKIEKAAQYFDPANSNRFKQLDLLLLTQGWRDFVWKRLADSTLKISYLPESGFTVSGKLRSVLVNKPLANMNITLFAPGAKGNKMFAARTDSAGKYYLDGIELYGNQTLKLSASDNKGKKTGLLLLDTLANAPLSVILQPLIEADPSPELTLFDNVSSARIKLANRFKISEVVQLRAVNIQAAPKFVRAFGETYQSFGYPEYNFDITAKDYTYKDLQDFLVHKIPGAQANPDSAEGLMFYAGGKKLFPKFFVNKVEDLFERVDYYNLTMDQIISVKFDHMVTQGGGDVMLITLALKPSAFEKKQFNLINSDVAGYYNARTFYAPNYEYSSSKVDQRLTIHWEPMITTDEKGQATISYYNADPKSKIRVVVQGLTSKGEPIAATTSYVIK